MLDPDFKRTYTDIKVIRHQLVSRKMPAKTGRKGKKKAGGRTVALVKAAFENDNPGAGGGEVDTTGKLSPREAEEKVAQMIGEMKEKVEIRCSFMMQMVPFMQDSLARGLSKASSGVPKRLGNMNLLTYCEEYGEDYEEVLLAARTPKERGAFLAEFVDDEDENDENDPGTTVKGQRPPLREVTQTPSGARRGGGRTLRANVKAAPPPSETPMTRSKRGGGATAVRPPPSTRSRRGPPRATRAPSILMTTETGLLVTEVGPAPQLFTKDGAKFYSPTGKGMVAATPGPGGRRAVAKPAVDALRQGLYGDAARGKEGFSLKPKAREELRKGANPDHTLYQHLQAMLDRRLEETPKEMSAQCDRLRVEWKKGTDEMLATLRAALPSEKKEAAHLRGKGKGKAKRKQAAGDGGGSGDAVVDVAAVARVTVESAKVRLTAEGGPYDGKVFELLLEEGGDARMIGRSSGKKFKQKGVSLPKDTEVSTTHGKFETSGGKVTFMDLGSTNGTLVDGEEADEEQPYDVADGSKLLIGQGTFTVTITWES